jgi:hypothetical protein
MKKSITTFMLALIVSAAFAQTVVTRKVQPNLDTVVTTTVTTVTSVTHKYVPPAPVTLAGTYTISGPIIAKSGQTYQNLLIDCKNASTAGILCSNVSKVNIVNCKIINSKTYGINIQNCSNITVTGTFISNVGFGVDVYNSKTIKLNGNQMLNINGIDNLTLGHAVQFFQVSGAGNQVNNNRIESIAGVALHPHDVINIYQSNGLAGDSIQVIGNWIRGGQTTLWPTSGSGAAGIVVGDKGGSYQVCRNNILVNPGYVGIQAQGGTHIKVDHNQIYSSSTPASLVGMAWGNWSGTSSSDVTYAYNKVKWFDKNNKEDDANTNSPGLTIIANTWGANINASILPATIITMK